MSTVMFFEKRFLVAGATLPIIELLVTRLDGETVVNLSGYAAYFTFWYRDDPVTVVRAGYIYDAANGLVRYEFYGDELPTEGELRYQCTLYNRGTINQENPQEYCEVTSPVFVRKVLAA